MAGMQKIAENEARDDDVRVIIENSYSVTVERDGDRVMLSSEIMVDDDGYSDGSIIDLNIDYDWESGRPVSDSDKDMFRRKLTQASHVLDAGFRFRIIPK